MPKLSREQIELVKLILYERGELPEEWKWILFPPEKQEYELVYGGKQREQDVLADTMAVPLQPVYTFNEDLSNWHNYLIFGDNAQVLKSLLRNAEIVGRVKLVYIDPPFGTGQDFFGNALQHAYEDRISGARFIEFLRKRLILLRELLADDGAIFVHLDSKKGHYIKVILDEVFGEHRFENEIVWHYPDNFQGNVNRFPNNHNVLYVYSRSERTRFKKVVEPLEKVRKRDKRIWDKDRKRLTAARDSLGNIIYEDYTHKYIDDVWNIGQSSVTKERSSEYIDYPTQKPEELLRRVIESVTEENDIVLDAFAGSGTTLAVAEKLGRRWIGIDTNKFAIYTIQKRLLNLCKGIGNKGEPMGAKPFVLYNAGLYDFASLRDLPWDAWRFFALNLFECRDKPFTIGTFELDGERKGAPVKVFNWQEYQGELVSEETIDDIHAAIGQKIGSKFYIIAPMLSFEFQQDYIDRDGVRYYALRIPYSFIDELHNRDFQSALQARTPLGVNNIQEAYGFSFMIPPNVEFEIGSRSSVSNDSVQATITTRKFTSRAKVKGTERHGGKETLAMLLLDLGHNGSVFDLDLFFFGEELEAKNWTIQFEIQKASEKIMAIWVDFYGNEFRAVIPMHAFEQCVDDIVAERQGDILL